MRLPFDESPQASSIKGFLVSSRTMPSKLKHRLMVVISLGVILLVLGIILASNHFLITVPVSGGEITEGLVGTPRFINPLLATSDADKDLVALVYSGLLRSGKLERYQPDLAESYSISPDGLTYTFKLRSDLYWHDGSPVTTRDVIFTIQMTQDDRIKSPRRASWDGVLVKAVDDLTMTITLKEPYAPFIENTTLGILPEHLWKDVGPEEFALHVLNLRPVGTGPYKILGLTSDATGVPTSISLEAFTDFALGAPLIERINLAFFPSEEELLAATKDMPSMAISGVSSEIYQELLADDKEIKMYDLPRIFAVFFNQNQSTVLAEKSVREALLLATPKDRIVELALGGLGKTIETPLPSSETDRATDVSEEVSTPSEILEAAGWKLGENGLRSKKQKPLRIELATSDSPELKKTAAILSESWRAIGVETIVKVYEQSDLNVNVIRPRKFDALLFGEGLGHFPDPYAFWHSSQRLDPYLNVAQYTNSRADKALEEIRGNSDRESHRKASEDFLAEIKKDLPAIFLYAPGFAYLADPNVKGLEIPFLGSPADRFNQVYKWYLSTEELWPVFRK